MTPTSLDEIMDTAIDLMRLARHRMTCDSRGSMANFLQLHALAIINEHEGITMKELAEILHITSPSATAFVQRLVKMGWLARKHDKKNRKLVRLRISPRGRSMIRRNRATRLSAMRRTLAVLSLAELKSFAQILRKIHHSHSSKQS